ncbi:hypothetical protein Dimus_022107, partial [Dionaea muscipula]
MDSCDQVANDEQQGVWPAWATRPLTRAATSLWLRMMARGQQDRRCQEGTRPGFMCVATSSAQAGSPVGELLDATIRAEVRPSPYSYARGQLPSTPCGHAALLHTGQLGHSVVNNSTGSYTPRRLASQP